MNMTAREATELAERFVKTWPAGPKQGIWFDVLTEHCEHDAAWFVYRQHRDTAERPPSIAGFLATYRHHAARDRAPDPPRTNTDDGPVMSFAEYIALLTVKAAAGDRGATHMLDVWGENMGRTTYDRPT